MYASKYCADLTPLKLYFDEHIEPMYAPLIAMLPEDYQLALLDETAFAGLSAASCVLVGGAGVLLVLVWLSFVSGVACCSSGRRAQAASMRRLNEQLLALNNRANAFRFERATLEHCIGELEARVDELGEKEVRLSELSDKCVKMSQENAASTRELERLRSAEHKQSKELSAARVELAAVRESAKAQHGEYEQKLAKLQATLGERQAALADVQARLAECERRAQEASDALELSETQRAQLAAQLDEKEQKIDALQQFIQKEHGEKLNKASSSSSAVGLSVDNIMQVQFKWIQIFKNFIFIANRYGIFYKCFSI